jgi:hypothetical protein
MSSPASGFLLFILGALALIVVDLIIALIEGVTLTLLKWSSSRTSLMVSYIMNIISGIINGILLVLLQDNPLVWLPVSFVLSVLIEFFIMSYFKRDTIFQNCLFVIIANLASYVLLILPAFYYGTRTQ